ncbi:co-chaperone YbbN [Methanogenium cariaci]|uniref:thioredoxin family protein n=1 Tax=Methanogenium cariaci TaxID=2197 RepID=UPI001FDF6C0D|nr:protein disulfide isomerase family protein [Methanogenium cariaci]
MPETTVRELKGTDWEKTVEKNSLPVAVMFYSPTCSHCKTMEPYFHTYAEEYAEDALCPAEPGGKSVDR